MVSTDRCQHRWLQEMLEIMLRPTAEGEQEKRVNEIKFEHLPEKLYRYRAIRKELIFKVGNQETPCFEGELQNLENDFVWMSNPVRYNDPFDSIIRFSPEVLTANVNQEQVSRFSKTLKHPLSAEQIEQIANSSDGAIQIIDLSVEEHQEFSAERRAEIKRELSSHLKTRTEELAIILTEIIQGGAIICSFSERNDSILMWSHYAENHTGFCVEYSFKQLPQDDARVRALYPVHYGDDRFDATPFLRERLKDKATINKLFSCAACLYKAKEWSYEREWRLVQLLRPNATGREWKMPKPTKILLGAKIEKGIKDRILKVANKNQIEMKQMTLSKNSYQMVETEL